MPDDLPLRPRIDADGKLAVAEVQSIGRAVDALGGATNQAAAARRRTERRTHRLRRAWQRLSAQLRTGIQSFVAGGL